MSVHKSLKSSKLVRSLILPVSFVRERSDVNPTFWIPLREMVSTADQIYAVSRAHLSLILRAMSSSKIWSFPNWFPNVNHLKIKAVQSNLLAGRTENSPWPSIVLPPKDLNLPSTRTHPLDQSVCFVGLPTGLSDLTDDYIHVKAAINPWRDLQASIRLELDTHEHVFLSMAIV